MDQPFRVSHEDPSFDDSSDFLWHHMRRSCAIVINSSTKSMKATDFDALTSQLVDYLKEFTKQITIIGKLSKRAFCNFGDVLHALKIFDRPLFELVVSSYRSSDFILPDKLDCEQALDVYAATLLPGMYNHRHDKNSSIEIAETYMDVAMHNAVSLLKTQTSSEGFVPKLEYDQFVSSNVLLPMNSSTAIRATNLRPQAGSRQGLAGISECVSFELSSLPRRLIPLDTNDGVCGSYMQITSASNLEEQQMDLIRYLQTTNLNIVIDSDPNVFPIPTLPICFPEEFEPWMPVVSTSLSLIGESDQKSSNHTAVSPPSGVNNGDNNENRIELQLELCSIEAEHPIIIPPEDG